MEFARGDAQPVMTRFSLLRVLGWTCLISACLSVIFIYLETRQPAFARSQKPGALVINTDMASAANRNAIEMHRAFMSALLAEKGRSASLFDACGAHSSESYRFTYKDAWMQDSFTVAITTGGRGAIAEWSRISADKSHGFPELEAPGFVSVSAADWAQFKSQVRLSPWLQMAPSETDAQGNPVLGLDGNTWTLEACVEGQYHMTERWSPDRSENTPMVALAKTMIRIGGSKFRPPDYVVIKTDPT